MVTRNHHRKLINNLTNATSSFPFCVLQCDPQLNPSGLCCSDCIIFCPSFCHTTESSPTPSPASTYYEQPPPSNHHHNHPPLSLPLKISLIFLFATFIYTLYKFYTIWFRSTRHRTLQPPSPENQETLDHDHNDVVDHPIWHIRTTGLQPSVINAITVVKFYKTDCVIEGTDCSVCLTEFDIDDLLRLLPNCKHAFHISCIDTWLQSHTNCPLCRAGVVDNTVDATSPERNNVDSGVNRETDLGVSIVRDGDQGEASGTSELRIGETDEQDVNNNNVSKREG